MSVLSVSNLAKFYKKYSTPWLRLLEWVFPIKKCFHDLHWVIRDLSFDLERGEALGIIGRNGVGKSTLLKLISGTAQPSSGTITIQGKVAALLELGIGFHPDLTGRQNVYLAGQLLGHSTAELDANFESILSFAELGEFVDEPVRTYSSGMQIRLAFSIATAVRPDILIVDEALAVGDAYFQHRCIQKIRSFKEKGTAILFVSHDPSAIKTLCDRAILLEEGIIVKMGSPDYVLDYYNALIAQAEKSQKIMEIAPKNEISGGKTAIRSGNQKATITKVNLLEDGQPVSVIGISNPVSLCVYFKLHQPLYDLTVGVLIKDRLGNEVFGTNTHHLGIRNVLENIENEYCAEFKFANMTLGTGHYSLTVALHAQGCHLQENYDWWDQALIFHVVPMNQPVFTGTCYLATECQLGALAQETSN